MRKTYLLSMLILFLASCNKDKFTTQPQLKYESVNTTVLDRGETLVMNLSFTDAEGDLSDTLTIIKSAQNCSNSFRIAPYKLPAFPLGKNQSGDIVVTFSYNDVSPKCFPKNDTAVFKFVLKDKAQNKSDTAVSETIVIIN